jgi:TNF receptor-associated factor 3
MQLEGKVVTLDTRLADIHQRFQHWESTSYDGTLIWKISEYQRRKAEAVAGTNVSLYSQPFYSSRFGYKMCLRVYLNGDGIGRNTHMSLFFVLMKGEFDALLKWPFSPKVTLTLMDQERGIKPLSDTFRPDPTSSSFARPRLAMNIASGCPLFVAHSHLEGSSFLKDDALFIKCVLGETDTTGV